VGRRRRHERLRAAHRAAVGGAFFARRFERYVFVSSISVYGDFSGAITEMSPVAELEDPDTEEDPRELRRPEGRVRARRRRGVRRAQRTRSRRIESSGRTNPTDRFTYWPRRIAAAGEVLGPGDPGAPVQFVDPAQRPLAAWLVRLALEGPGGVFNATGPSRAAHVR